MGASQGSQEPGGRRAAERPLLSVVPPPVEAPPPALHSSIVIGRRLGTVVVTVHGELDAARAHTLGTILADLIDGQGNLSLVVDLHDATTADPDSLLVLTDAAERARRRGGTVRLDQPHPGLAAALQVRDLDHFAGRGE